jgi:hypothetical protein
VKTRLLVGSVVGLLVLGIVLAACGGAQEPAPGSGAQLDGKALVEDRCTKCHGLETVTGAQKSSEGWQSTVDRMIGHGAQLDAAETAAVIDHLSEAYPE